MSKQKKKKNKTAQMTRETNEEQHVQFIKAFQTILAAKKEDVDMLSEMDDEEPDYNKKFKLP